jgi:hypothetical protein
MEHELRIHLRAEVLPGPIRLDAAGCLTQDNCTDLLGILDRAVALSGCPSITVSLAGLGHLEPGARDVLRHCVTAWEHGSGVPDQEPLEVPPVISIHTPSRPRHCSAPHLARTYEDLQLGGPARLIRADRLPERPESRV